MYYRYYLHETKRPAHFGIRNHRYKLIFFYGQHLNLPGVQLENTAPAWEFYDLQKDPRENHNAYNDLEYADVIAEMKKEMIEYRIIVGDTDERFPEMDDVLAKHQLK